MILQPSLPEERFQDFMWPQQLEGSATSEDLDTTEWRQIISSAITNNMMPTYVYTYPPRQTYRPLPSSVTDNFITKTINETPGNFNLYLHIPFCRQICNFCNLFTVIGHPDVINDYVEALLVELNHYAQRADSQKLRTVYLGGGTPSLLSEAQLVRIFNEIEKHFPGFRDTCDEICIEAAPDTITTERTSIYQDLGITRINLGIQTFCEVELENIGRKYAIDVNLRAVEILKQAQIENLCIDLINGLFGQTRQTWEESVSAVLSLRPETFCVYPLTVRPSTGYYPHKDMLRDFGEIYTRYDMALSRLVEAGYTQETHIRFVIPDKGGYKQKEYHWEGATVLGIGAGARTYASRLHYRNGYSARHRSSILTEYLANVSRQGHARVDGFMFDRDESLRREFALNLHRIDKASFQERYSIPFDECFPTIISALESECLLNISDTKIEFTKKGLKYRDLISRLFFSKRVRELEATYSYND